MPGPHASPQNLKSLSRQLGLSPSTVSRVLSGQAERFRISSGTRDRILAAARDSGVVIDPIARGLRTRSTMTLGLLVPDISNPFFAQLASQVEHLARARGYGVLLADAQESVEVENQSLNLMLGRRVDGLVLAPVAAAPQALATVKAVGIPCVQVDRVFADPDLPSVATANFDGARQAVELFLEHGHRAIACIQGLPGNHANDERVRGFRAALQSAGLALPSGWLTGGDYTPETGGRAIDDLFAKETGARPTAILALGNLIALGALRALRRRHLDIPRQVSLIAFDQQPWADLIDPPLTTVTQPLPEIAASAMELLFDRLKDTKAPVRQLTLPVTLEKRGSVAPAAFF